jgi:hypothetical protein
LKQRKVGYVVWRLANEENTKGLPTELMMEELSETAEVVKDEGLFDGRA